MTERKEKRPEDTPRKPRALYPNLQRNYHVYADEVMWKQDDGTEVDREVCVGGHIDDLKALDELIGWLQRARSWMAEVEDTGN